MSALTCDFNRSTQHMGEETSDQLEFIPASIKIIKHIWPKFSCQRLQGAVYRTLTSRKSGVCKGLLSVRLPGGVLPDIWRWVTYKELDYR